VLASDCFILKYSQKTVCLQNQSFFALCRGILQKMESVNSYITIGFSALPAFPMKDDGNAEKI